ncbi:MAG: non-ribosomal peptide synthetase, partial [Ktedonobacteraceae bacterium]
MEQGDEQKIFAREKHDPLPVSFAQQRLWFLSQLNPDSPAYTISSAVRLQGRLNIALLEASLNEIVRRHEALRATFSTVQGEVVQSIASTVHIPLPVVEMRVWPEIERETEIQRLIAQEIRQPFHLAQGPLLRARLFSLGETEHVFLFVIHHIIFDGWSRNVLLSELAILYNAFSKDRPSPLPELPIQYTDFAAWQRQWLTGERAKVQTAYWKQRLAHFSTLQLPTDRPRPKLQTLQGATRSFVLPEHLTQALQTFSKREGFTLFTLLLAAFKIVLYRYTGQTDLMVGVPTANRNQIETEALIGLFVNTLVIRSKLSGNLSFQNLLEYIRIASVEAFENQDLPFEKVVDLLQPERDLGLTPLFQVMFDFQHIPSKTYEISDLFLHPLETDDGTAKFDLEFNLWEGLAGIYGSVEYNTDIYDATTIARMIGHYQTILNTTLTHPQTSISQLALLTHAECQQITVSWNNTYMEYDLTRHLHQLVEEQVKCCPEATSVICEDEQLSYHVLNQRANQLAHYLQTLGVQAETCVGICMERSLEMVIGLLGILKAGGAYVPLDPTYPQERLTFMLEDAHISVLLTQEHLLQHLPERGMKLVPIDTLWDTLAKEAVNDLRVDLVSENTAYVIYTSGSTGKPKGVMVTHAGICNRLLWMQDTYQISQQDHVLQKTPFSFDVSVWEFFWPLITGAKLVMAKPGGHRDPTYLARIIAERQITTLHFVPPMLQAFLAEKTLPLPTTLKRVICSGEALSFDLQERFFAHIDAELHNLYGPTEASVDVTFWACQRQSSQRIVPLGHPIANTQIYLLDALLQPVPVGVPGELCIGGRGLARGYLGRSELTAEKFIPNPFSQQPGERLYKTGDVARFLENGVIEYLGRIDHQVKIRGFRIELGEVE